jgi:hypothetical protein
LFELLNIGVDVIAENDDSENVGFEIDDAADVTIVIG